MRSPFLRFICLLVLLLAVASFVLLAATPPSAQSSARSLSECVKSGDMKALAESLRAGADPNARDADGMTALHYAAYRGNVDAAKLLLSAKADVKAADSLGLTPLHAAAFEGKTEVARYLLQKGAAVDAKDLGGNSPLHYAVLNGHPEAAEALLGGGADPQAVNKRGQSPLQIARVLGDPKVAFLLDAQSAAPARSSTAVRTYTNEDLDRVRRTNRLAFDGNPETSGQPRTAEIGAPSPAEGISDAYSNIDRLVREKRDIESRLPALRKSCEEFNQRYKELEPSTSDQDQKPDVNEAQGYSEGRAQAEKAACGPLAEAQSRLDQIEAELISLRSTVSQPTEPAAPKG